MPAFGQGLRIGPHIGQDQPANALRVQAGRGSNISRIDNGRLQPGQFIEASLGYPCPPTSWIKHPPEQRQGRHPVAGGSSRQLLGLRRLTSPPASPIAGDEAAR